MRYRLFITVGIILAVILGGGVIAAQIVVNNLAEEKIRSSLLRFRDRADVQFDGVDVNMLEQSLTMRDVAITMKNGRHARVGSLEVKNIDRKHLRSPHFLTLEMEGLSIPVDAANFGKELPRVQELGLEAIMVDMVVDYRYEPEAKRLSVNDFGVDIAGGGAFQVAFAVDNFSVADVRKQRFEDLQLNSMDLHYKDISILRGVLQAAGEEEQDLLRTIEEWLKEEVELAQEQNNQAAIDPLKALLAYVQNPTTLSLRVTLKEPLTLAKIEPIKKVTALLGLFTFTIN